MNSQAVTQSPEGLQTRDRARLQPKDRRNAFIASSLGWLLDGFETYAVVLVGHQVVTDLVGRGASEVYFGGILAITLAAWACGGLLSGILADYLGRKRTLMLSIVWYAVFTGLTALSPNYAIFMVFRFLTGLGMGAEWGPGSALVSEIWSDRSRGRGIALLQGCFGIGFIIATGVWQFVNVGPHAWKYMFIIGVLPAVLALYVWRFAKDPDMWVDSDTRRRSAKARAQEGGNLSDEDKALTTFTLSYLFKQPALRRQTLKLLILASSTLIGWWAVSTWIPQYSAQIARHAGANPANTSTIVALCYNGGAVLGYFLMGWLADLFGRKKTMFAYFVGALVMVPVLFLVASTPGSLAIFAAINGFFTLGQFTWIAMYPVELYPTHIRGTAITFIFNATRYIAALFAVFAGYLATLFGAVSTAAVVIGSVYLLGVALSLWAGPETKRKPLPA